MDPTNGKKKKWIFLTDGKKMDVSDRMKKNGCFLKTSFFPCFLAVFD